ncbi:MAG: S-layer homology domain-containing protein [Candidatus Margulisiibacteriota bacterium]
MRDKCLYIVFIFIVFAFQSAEALKATIDPSELAVGARPLGVGRAYVALADDVSTIFQNPAGLARIKEWHLTSMYTSLFGEVQYNQVGGMLSLGKDAIGFGYVGASIGGSLLVQRDPVTNRIVPIGGAIGYSSSVVFLSGATQRIENLSLGGSLKIFGQSLNGMPAGDASALGQDIDIGLKYTPASWLSLGACGYNILPYAAGGRLIWEGGIPESIPSSLKMGMAISLLGPGGLREFRTHNLKLAYDYEFFPTQMIRPGLHHIGMEWVPWQNVAFRIGLDQDAVSGGANQINVDNNLAAGIGVSFFGTQLDYAFHTFGSLTENSTHFFSLSVGGEEEKPEVYVEPEKKIYLEITSPLKKIVTFGDKVEIKGNILITDEVSDVKINQAEAVLLRDNSFVYSFSPEHGKNILEIKAMSSSGRILETHNVIIVRLVKFFDIKENDRLRVKLGAMAALGYLSGFPDGKFKPGRKIERADLCAMLMRVRPSEQDGLDGYLVFNDVPKDYWAAKYIYEAAQQGVVGGYLDGTFRPKRLLSRAEIVSVLVRFANFEIPKYIYERPFLDVSTKFWAAKVINVAKKHGLLDHLKGKSFRPEYKVTRGEVVEMLAKTEFVDKKIKDLIE